MLKRLELTLRQKDCLYSLYAAYTAEKPIVHAHTIAAQAVTLVSLWDRRLIVVVGDTHAIRSNPTTHSWQITDDGISLVLLHKKIDELAEQTRRQRGRKRR
jgi:aspartokinase-like uncharacterized kinase